MIKLTQIRIVIFILFIKFLLYLYISNSILIEYIFSAHFGCDSADNHGCLLCQWLHRLIFVSAPCAKTLSIGTLRDSIWFGLRFLSIWNRGERSFGKEAGGKLHKAMRGLPGGVEREF